MIFSDYFSSFKNSGLLLSHKMRKSGVLSNCQEITHKFIWWFNMNDKTNIIDLAVM